MTAGREVVLGSSAEIHVLFEGYVGDRVASTVSLVRDGEERIVIDPGMVPDVERAILEPLARLGESPETVTDVVLSHHHPDHTMHAGLFRQARVHDHWAVYRRDRWESRPADGFLLAPSVLLIQTPGHTPQDVTTLAGTAAGLVAFTHLWWDAGGPPEDPLATDPAALHAGRRRVLEAAALIVPGHGPAFPSGPGVPD